MKSIRSATAAVNIILPCKMKALKMNRGDAVRHFKKRLREGLRVGMERWIDRSKGHELFPRFVEWMM
jgi:hypothetical protein